MCYEEYVESALLLFSIKKLNFSLTSVFKYTENINRKIKMKNLDNYKKLT